MFCYRICTFVDISISSLHRDSSNELLQAQLSNFNSFIQGIGLRANITWDIDPILKNDKWYWDFYTEQEDVFNDGENPVGLLENDLNGIPIISNLTNKIAIYPAVISTQGSNKNTWIEYIPTKLSV